MIILAVRRGWLKFGSKWHFIIDEQPQSTRRASKMIKSTGPEPISALRLFYLECVFNGPFDSLSETFPIWKSNSVGK